MDGENLHYDGGYGNRSLHYFHYYAVLNWIDFSGIPDVHPHTCHNSPQQIAVSLLPSADDDSILKHVCNPCLYVPPTPVCPSVTYLGNNFNPGHGSECPSTPCNTPQNLLWWRPADCCKGSGCSKNQNQFNVTTGKAREFNSMQ